MRALFLLLLFAAIALSVWRLNERPAGPESGAETDTASPTETGAVAASETGKHDAGPAARAPTAGNGTATASEPCIRESEFPGTAAGQQLMARYTAIGTAGPHMEDYRAVDPATLNSLAEQGDSAAMAALGARAMLRGLQQPESRALDWLSFEVRDEPRFAEPPTPEAALHYNEAAHWFYQAALRGRLTALMHYGTAREALFGDAIGQGWIDAEDYEGLSTSEKSSLLPTNVYNSMMFQLAPELGDDPLFGIAPRLEQALVETVRAPLVAEFHADLAAAGLPPIHVPAVQMDALTELLERACGY